MALDQYTLIVVADERSPVRRFQVPRVLVKRAAGGAAAAVALFLLAGVDYVRVRLDNRELEALRTETAEQRQQIAAFQETLSSVETNLTRVRDFERKVRIIANLPGSVAAGGEDVADLVPGPDADEAAGGDGVALPPAGVPMEPIATDRLSADDADSLSRGEDFDADAGEPLDGQGGDEEALPEPHAMAPELRRLTSPLALEVVGMRERAAVLGRVAEERALSMDELLAGLESKSVKLASSPSIWPTRGWLTSRFGPRISPFTGRRQFHGGLDVAAKEGTPVVAPARGRVVFVGLKGPLGKTVKIDHGYGVRTLYGHNSDIVVKAGQQVERGQVIARVGSTGRSTGPHLHYTVEVGGKARNPLDYIFD
jgi:murein DD-endopeptidase MepM/ murein hydrolase activator NlpD